MIALDDEYVELTVTVEVRGDSENGPAEVLHHVLSQEPLVRAWTDSEPLRDLYVGALSALSALMDSIDEMDPEHAHVSTVAYGEAAEIIARRRAR